MALVRSKGRRYCIDRYEASLVRETKDGEARPWAGNQPVDGIEREMKAVSRAGVGPQGYISGQQARIACTNAGKRLCSEAEWSGACRGARDTVYPYGNVRQRGRCNDRFRELAEHPVQRLFRAYSARGENPREMWRPHWMNDARLHELPRTVSATGTFPDCTNELGVFDMVGNLHEWVDDPRGVFAGGYFMDTFRNGEGCEYRTRAHPLSYHDYSTGFRCCADAAGSEGTADG
jgi:formylglycine-generating enzyme required for sulfatase activity